MDIGAGEKSAHDGGVEPWATVASSAANTSGRMFVYCVMFSASTLCQRNEVENTRMNFERVKSKQRLDLIGQTPCVLIVVSIKV